MKTRLGAGSPVGGSTGGSRDGSRGGSRGVQGVQGESRGGSRDGSRGRSKGESRCGSMGRSRSTSRGGFRCRSRNSYRYGSRAGPGVSSWGGSGGKSNDGSRRGRDLIDPIWSPSAAPQYRNQGSAKFTWNGVPVSITDS